MTMPTVEPHPTKLPLANRPAPAVSVFLSVYNGGPYLEAAVESVLQQTFADFEFIIVNDGSTDGTAAYLESLEDARVRVIHQENQGLGQPLNKWLHQCQGAYIMRLDADDVCHPRRMEKQYAFLEAHPEVMLVGCQLQFFSDKGKGQCSALFTDHESILGGMLKGWHTISHPTIMFRKALLTKTEGYVITGPGEDWSLILDAAVHGKLAVLPEVLYLHRIHRSSNAYNGATRSLMGLEYARKRYKRFKEQGKPYELNEFMRAWEKTRKRPWMKARLRLKSISSVFYREHTLHRIAGNRLRSTCYLLVAATLDPHKTLGALKKKLGIKVNS